MPSDDMLSWLKATIEGDKAAAEAADKVSPGPWVNTGQEGLGDAWQIHGALIDGESGIFDWNGGEPVEVPVRHRVATLNYDDGGGVWEKAAADHIVLQQPRDTIARCEAELALLGNFERHLAVWPPIEDMRSDAQPGALAGGIQASMMVSVLKALARGYRHRPGFRPEWVEG